METLFCMDCFSQQTLLKIQILGSHDPILLLLQNSSS